MTTGGENLGLEGKRLEELRKSRGEQKSWKAREVGRYQVLMINLSTCKQSLKPEIPELEIAEPIIRSPSLTLYTLNLCLFYFASLVSFKL